MRPFWIVPITACVVSSIAAISGCTSTPAAPDADVAAVTDDSTKFAIDLYKQLRHEPGNLFFSPYSLSSALAMTYGGARAETAAQMAEALHFSLPQEDLPAAFATLNKVLNAGGSAGGFQLSLANRLWGQKGYSFVPAFLATTRDQFGAELDQVDFLRATEAARRQINTWVAEKTRQKILDLIPPNVLDEYTRLVLTNAIYFNGRWAEPFDVKETREGPFHMTGDKTMRVPFMVQDLWVRGCGRGDIKDPGNDLRLLELPYKGSDLTMVILLPYAVDGLPAIEQQLSAESLNRWLDNLQRQHVDLQLPWFQLDARFSLEEPLSALGMPLAFDKDRADFSGISSRKPFYLSAVVHQAFVRVDERGTEAAAATGVGMKALSRPEDFRVDHPFLFLIRDRKSGLILFMGRVQDPSV